MSPKPQIRAVKKKNTAVAETNTPSVDTEVDTDQSKTEQTAPSPFVEVTTTKELKEDTAQGATPTVSEDEEAESVSQTSTDSESTEATDAEKDWPIFQAIGTIQGKAQKDDEGKFYIRLGGKRYGLYFPGYRYQAWLKQAAANPDRERRKNVA